MPKSHRPYPPELRQRSVELVRKGRSPEELAQQFESLGPRRSGTGSSRRPGAPSPRRSVSTLTATRAPILSCTFLMNPLH